MPKIIIDVKETVLNAAGELLLSVGYSGFTLRKVASKCGIAVGTIYNYYKNKDTLIASVMLEDWQKALKNMNEAAVKSKSAAEGMKVIYKEIVNFRSLYISIWDQFASVAGSAQVIGKRHGMLRDEVAKIIKNMLLRLNFSCDISLSRILANMVISCATQDDIEIGSLKEVTERLF